MGYCEQDVKAWYWYWHGKGFEFLFSSCLVKLRDESLINDKIQMTRSNDKFKKFINGKTINVSPPMKLTI